MAVGLLETQLNMLMCIEDKFDEKSSGIFSLYCGERKHWKSEVETYK